MAGGKGTRLGRVKKPFMNICGKRLIDIVINVARHIKERKKIYICLGREDEEILGNINEDDIEIVICPSAGYVNDLDYVLKIVEFPVLVLPADMPFLSQSIIEEFLNKAQTILTDVVTLVACKNNICRETGISFFRRIHGDWVNTYFDDRIELRDIDTYEDLIEVQNICASMEVIEKRD